MLQSEGQLVRSWPFLGTFGKSWTYPLPAAGPILDGITGLKFNLADNALDIRIGISANTSVHLFLAFNIHLIINLDGLARGSG